MSDFLRQISQVIIFEVENFQFEQFLDFWLNDIDFVIAEIKFFKGTIHGEDLFWD